MTKPTEVSRVGDRTHPMLKEFTIAMGDADLYVNLDRHMDLDDEHVLYEAVLSDPEGSRVIYVDREELEACLKDSPILRHAPGAEDGPVAEPG